MSPLSISVEGTATVSMTQETPRPDRDVLSKTMQGLQNCLDEKVFTGVCTSLCQTNFADLMTEQWIDRLIEMGVLYTWFHVYRPMGPNANPELCLTPAQQRQAREFVVNMRPKKPIIIVDVYYDDQGQALCPAATGLSHHINPWGDIEPCPIVQFTKESIHPKDDARPLREKFMNSAFLRDFRELAQTTTRGCIVLERPDLLKKLVEKHDARDATARGTALAELGANGEIGRRSTLPARSCARRAGSTGSRSITGSTISASTNAPIFPPRRLRGSRAEPGSRPRRHRSIESGLKGRFCQPRAQPWERRCDGCRP